MNDLPAEPTLSLRTDSLHWQTVEGEVVALDLEKSLYYGANPAARLLWERLAAGTTRTALITLLASTYRISEDAATSDVDRFLASLRGHQLLR